MASIVEALRHALSKYNDGDLVKSEQVVHQVLEHEPENVDALHLLGLICRKAQRIEESLGYFQQIAKMRPAKAAYWFELGIAHKQLGDLEQALAANQQAVSLDPVLQEAYVNGGAALDDLGRHDEALAWYEKSIALKPSCPNTLVNMGNVYQTLGRFEDSIRSYRRVIELTPDNAHAHWNFAMALLRCGQFEQGWEEYEWRTRAGETRLDNYPQPLWDGSPLEGKTLLVHAEQGVGDEVLFASCYPDLIGQAKHCIFVCEQRLAPILARSFPQATVHGYRRRHEQTPCEVAAHVDFQIAAGSLPRYLRRRPEDFPQRSHYLKCDPVRRDMWRQRLAALGPGLKIGISWRAGGKPSEHVRRTTGLALWRRLLALPGAHFVNLQYGEAADEIAEAKQRWGVTIHDWPDADALTDLEGLAAQMSALDLVIAVGNTTVHLAGSLGVPAWSILPAYPSWRWMSDVDRVPWYSSVRLFRQLRGEGWKRVFNQVHDELCLRLDLPHATGTSHYDIDDAETDRESAAAIPAQVSGIKFVARLNERIESAVKLHQGGELAAAEQIYREVLKSTPQHIDALHLLGVVCQQTGRLEQGLKYLRQAIALCDTVAGFHFHLGVALRQIGDRAGAIAAYRRTIEIKPSFAEAVLNLGACLQETGQLDEAIDCYRQALTSQPDTAGIHLNLGAAYSTKGDLAAAERHLREALRMQPGYPEAEAQLGQVLQKAGHIADAIDCFRRAIALRPQYALAHRCLGKAYQVERRFDEAILSYQEALELKPGVFEVPFNLAIIFEHQQQYALAAGYYRQALRLVPNHVETLTHLTAVLRHLGQHDEALATCEALLDRDPKNAAAVCQRAEILLGRGDLAAGWDAMKKVPGMGRDRMRRLNLPVWDGTSLAGRAILVHGADNLTDEVQYASCLNEVVARAESAVVLCDPRLVPLWSRSFPAARVLSDTLGSTTGMKLPACDVQTCLADLPRLLRRSCDDFPAQPHYLAPNMAMVRECDWRTNAVGSMPKVGLLRHSLRKSATAAGMVLSADHWRPLLETPNIEWVDLNDPRLTHRSDAALNRSIDAWSARLAALDLVIGVDDFVMHLAAAAGRPTWVLLSAVSQWRWALGQIKSPWYPAAKMFRPARLGAWPQVIKQLIAELETFSAEFRPAMEARSSAAAAKIAPPKFLQSPVARGEARWP